MWHCLASKIQFCQDAVKLRWQRLSKSGFGHSPQRLNEWCGEWEREFYCPREVLVTLLDCFNDWERYCTVWSLSPSVSTNVAKTERDDVMSKRGFGQSPRMSQRMLRRMRAILYYPREGLVTFPECLDECCGDWEGRCNVEERVWSLRRMSQRMSRWMRAILFCSRGGHSPSYLNECLRLMRAPLQCLRESLVTLPEYPNECCDH